MRIVRATGCALALAAVVGYGGCGEDEERVNRERPAATINVVAAILDGRIEVSPRMFGAGPIRLLITNQTASAQAVTFETDEVDGPGPGITQSTSPINPAGTATIEVDVRRGRYELRTSDRGIEPVAVRVGARRASAQNALLQP